MLSHGERIRATTCRNRAPFTIRSKEMMIFNLSSLVSSDIVLRVKGAGLNGSEKSESSQAWIRNQFSRPFRLPYDVIVWAMYPCHHDQDARYYRILICKPSCSQHFFFFFFFRLVNFERDEISTRNYVSTFLNFHDSKRNREFRTPHSRGKRLFCECIKTPDKYRAGLDAVARVERGE